MYVTVPLLPKYMTIVISPNYSLFYPAWTVMINVLRKFPPPSLLNGCGLAKAEPGPSARKPFYSAHQPDKKKETQGLGSREQLVSL